MENKEVLSTNITPRFDGSNYTFYRIRMDVYLQSLGVDIWNSLVNGNINLETTPTEPIDRRLYEYNVNARNAILFGLENIEYTKFMQCTLAKEIWDKMRSIYEGDEKIKKQTLQTFLAQFATLQMK